MALGATFLVATYLTTLTTTARLSNAEEEHDAFCRVLPLWLHH
jgi:hypothetical protein